MEWNEGIRSKVPYFILYYICSLHHSKVKPESRRKCAWILQRETMTFETSADCEKEKVKK